MKKILAGSLLVMLLAACASGPSYNTLSPAQREKFDRMQLVEDPVTRRHETLGLVEGSSCFRSLFSGPATREEATEIIFVRAARYEADAVKNLKCRSEGISFSRNCWNSVICAGWAIRFDPTDSSSSRGW